MDVVVHWTLFLGVICSTMEEGFNLMFGDIDTRIVEHFVDFWHFQGGGSILTEFHE